MADTLSIVDSQPLPSATPAPLSIVESKPLPTDQPSVSERMSAGAKAGVGLPEHQSWGSGVLSTLKEMSGYNELHDVISEWEKGNHIAAAQKATHLASTLVVPGRRVIEGALQTSADQSTKALQAIQDKKPSEALTHGIAAMLIPLAPSAEGIDKIQNGDVAGGVTQIAANLGSMYALKKGGEAVPGVTEAEPSAPKAETTEAPAGSSLVGDATKSAAWKLAKMYARSHGIPVSKIEGVVNLVRSVMDNGPEAKPTAPAEPAPPVDANTLTGGPSARIAQPPVLPGYQAPPVSGQIEIPQPPPTPPPGLTGFATRPTAPPVQVAAPPPGGYAAASPVEATPQPEGLTMSATRATAPPVSVPQPPISGALPSVSTPAQTASVAPVEGPSVFGVPFASLNPQMQALALDLAKKAEPPVSGTPLPEGASLNAPASPVPPQAGGAPQEPAPPAPTQAPAASPVAPAVAGEDPFIRDEQGNPLMRKGTEAPEDKIQNGILPTVDKAAAAKAAMAEALTGSPEGGTIPFANEHPPAQAFDDAYSGKRAQIIADQFHKSGITYQDMGHLNENSLTPSQWEDLLGKDPETGVQYHAPSSETYNQARVLLSHKYAASTNPKALAASKALADAVKSATDADLADYAAAKGISADTAAQEFKDAGYDVKPKAAPKPRTAAKKKAQ